MKIMGWTLGILIFLIVGGIFGARSYRQWQERRLVAQANALVNEGDLKRAGLDARRILQINPESVQGARIMARISERSGAPSAVEWRRRATDLAPGNAEDLLALARAAMRFEDEPNREYALSHLPESAKTTGEYHALAADLAARKRDTAEMEQHLREAVRLDPANKEYQLHLGAYEVSSNDRAVRDDGRRILTQLQADPAMRREATRRLVEDALRRSDFDRAAEYARQLQDLPDHDFSDRLLLLSALHGGIDPGFTPLLQQLQVDTADKPEEIAELITWLNGNQMPAAAIAWAAQLPPNVVSQKGVPIALSDSYTAARDWTGLQRMVKNAKWGGVDFLRHALAARAARELGDHTESTAQWNEAVKKIGADPKEALTLAEIVQKWGWRDEAIELLWVAAKDPAKGDDALKSLYTYFAKNGASQDLYRVLLRRREFHPDDLNIQNNVAQLSVLLNLNADQGQRLARDLFEKDPKNPAYVSTYAFALHAAGDSKKALKIFSGLTEQQLHQPEIAAYYGVVLAGVGEHERAAEFLGLGENAELLPEERGLIEKARRTLARR
jgi:tetratricopeptide (TPR) repeat protein